MIFRNIAFYTCNMNWCHFLTMCNWPTHYNFGTLFMYIKSKQLKNVNSIPYAEITKPFYLCVSEFQ